MSKRFLGPDCGVNGCEREVGHIGDHRRVGPRRIRRKRTKGWRAPDGAMYVGRPTKWGNPFSEDSEFVAAAAAVLGVRDLAEASVLLHRAWMRGAHRIEPVQPWSPEIEFTEGRTGGSAWIHGAKGVGLLDLPKCPDVMPLHGFDLMCWCPLDQPCHADVLLELANQ